MRTCQNCHWFKDWAVQKSIFNELRPDRRTTCLKIQRPNWKDNPQPSGTDICLSHETTEEFVPDPGLTALVKEVAKEIARRKKEVVAV